MSLPKIDHQTSFFDTDQVCSGLLNLPGSRKFTLFSEHVWPALMEVRPQLEEMYCTDNGRPAEEPIRMLGVLILQFMERMPDRQAADACTFDLRWKHALSIPIDGKAFHPTSLVKFRNRLLEHGLETLGFDVVLDAMRSAGYLRKRSKQRIDSTHIIGLVRNMSSLENLRETIRITLESISKDKSVIRPDEWSTWWERYVECTYDYRATKSDLIKKKDQAGLDIFAILNWADTQVVSGSSVKSLDLLKRVFEENYTTSKDGVEERSARPAGAVVNPHDPDAEWCKKGTIYAKKKDWMGYKSHVAETVEEPVKSKNEPTKAIVTSVVTVVATSSDKVGIKKVEDAIGNQEDLQCEELYVDAGYTSASELERYQSKGCKLKGPVQPAPKPKGRFSVEEFNVNIKNRTAVCPAGKLNTQCSRIEEKSGKITYRYEWSTHCHDCPRRKECVSKTQKHRTITVGKNHALLQQRRKEMKTDEFRKEMYARNGIEGTISELVRAHGFRKCRFRGLHKIQLQNLLIGAACNLKRWAHRCNYEEQLLMA